MYDLHVTNRWMKALIVILCGSVFAGSSLQYFWKTKSLQPLRPLSVSWDTGQRAKLTREQSKTATSYEAFDISYRTVTSPNFTSIIEIAEDGSHHVTDSKWMTERNVSEGLVVSAPELIEKIPTKFLENFRSPCWLRNGSHLNCLPYFYIVGMYKCGTTDLWDKLIAHPDVINVPKEPHWWGARRAGWTAAPIHREQVKAVQNITGGSFTTLEWYLNWCKRFAVKQILNTTVTTPTGTQYHPRVFGDASISTAYVIGEEWKKLFPNATEPPYTNADVMHAVQPNAKIVMIVRNPTDRAFSWYFFASRARTAESWHKAATRHIDCFNRCRETHSLRYCVYAGGCPYHLLQDIQVGIYHVYISDWMRAYSRDGILVLRLEDWYKDPINQYNRLLKFLELSPLTKQQEQKIFTRSVKNVNRRKHTMLNETRKALDDFYRPFNKELAKLMNDDRYLYERE